MNVAYNKSREGVGFINQETCDGIDYVIDGAVFYIIVDGGGPI